MKNNLKALILHLIIVILSIIFLIIFVATGPKIGQYATNVISRLFIGITFLFVYIFMGTFLDKDRSKKYDFFTGCFIAVIGIALWYYTFLITGKHLFEIPKDMSEYWILMNVYHSPFILINFLFELPYTPLVSLIMNFFPTLLMGIGLKYKRFRSVKTTN